MFMFVRTVEEKPPMPLVVEGPQTKLLRESRQRIVEGWTKHRSVRYINRYNSEDGVQYCATGSLLHGNSWYGYDALRGAQERLKCALPWPWRTLSPFVMKVEAFNDVPWRMKGGVLRLYDRAIAMCPEK